MLFTITYDEELCGLSIAKKDKETIPPVYEQIYRAGGLYKLVTDAYSVENACERFWGKYHFRRMKDISMMTKAMKTASKGVDINGEKQ